MELISPKPGVGIGVASGIKIEVSTDSDPDTDHGDHKQPLHFPYTRLDVTPVH